MASSGENNGSQKRLEGESYWQGESATPGQDANAIPAQLRQAYANQTVRQKDHIAAGLFAVFLGVFGMHKFYLGYNQAAFIMLAVSIVGSLFTFGLAAAVVWLIAIVEGIIYLSKSQSDFDKIYVVNQRDWF